MEDLLEELKQLDEVYLLELLDIDSSLLVDIFHKRIEKRRKFLEEKLSGTERRDDDEWASD